jgi:putative nucleotidyltransferase with HDIG domain
MDPGSAPEPVARELLQSRPTTMASHRHTSCKPWGVMFTPALYVWSVNVIGIAIVAASTLQLIWFPLDFQLGFLVLAVLALVSGASVLRLPYEASFSVGDAFSFAALFLYGIEAGTLTVVLDALAISLRLKYSFARTVFNVAAPCLAMWCAAGAVFGLGGLPLPVHATDVATALVGIAAPVAIVFVVGSGLIANAVALHEASAVGHVWRQHFAQLWVNPVAGGYLGALMAFGVHRYGVAALLVIAPIPGILYLAFRASVNRLDDHLRHLSELNRMNQSTIEAFATAVDAKDQVTHGHIRRVQTYCLALARDLEADDEGTLKALEAAALLHDVGKIGIPEHILNKPGKLTPAEFDVMKQHVAIGAGILSTVEFPFPVVPIVQNHHESWDGSGYPNGVRGEDIPLGARILSVVDCFDALTSDRPYRAAMSVQAAFDILRERRGSMYDPQIVDRFIVLQPRLPLVHEPVAQEQAPPVSPPVAAQPAGVDKGIAQTLVDMLAAALPDNLCVAYEVDVKSACVIATATAGPGAAQVIGHRVALGYGVSGWVAASRSLIQETNAGLDFQGSSLGSALGSQRCSSVALPLPAPLVITVYGSPLLGQTRAALTAQLPDVVSNLVNIAQNRSKTEY